MQLPRHLGIILLAIWLIVFGLLPILDIHNPTVRALVALLAVAAGVILLWERRTELRT